MPRHEIRFFYLLAALSFCVLASACSPQDLQWNVRKSPSDGIIEDLNRKNPDFIQGETVTTGTGFKIRAAFGEISEKKSLNNGFNIEGAFYE